ncbi:MAG: PLDc N-terminal domain-containing protein [Bacteroidota bacterium]
MKKSTKIWLGILTFLSVLFFVIYIVGIFTLIVSHIPELENNNGEFPLEFFKSFIVILIFILIAIIIKFGLMIYYIIHASNNVNNDSSKKIMWILILVFVGFIGNIVYYFLEILPLKEVKPEPKL